MKKNKTHSLKLTRETIRALDTHLDRVVGGLIVPTRGHTCLSQEPTLCLTVDTCA